MPSGKPGIDVTPFENDNCPVKKAIIPVNSIPINSAPFTFKDIRTIVIPSPANASSTGAE